MLAGARNVAEFWPEVAEIWPQSRILAGNGQNLAEIAASGQETAEIWPGMLKSGRKWPNFEFSSSRVGGTL